ncbi:MAG: DUF3769 domain-containing protein [Stigonema ocellatum SAG 48.90 = DSM 106950]|nr:DUF3769 domain-containing protein [Stigonema ocellatum SAG 48.90 = DSM 106950]
MLHPVLPPEPPLILEPLERANPNLRLGDTQSKSVVKLALGTARDDSTQNELVVPKTLSAPSTPETFPAEFSPLTPVNSAAFLGQQLSVGYPLQQVEVSGSHDVSNPQISAQTSPPTEQVYPTLTNSKNLSQTRARLLVEKLAQAKQHRSDAYTENSAIAPIQQPITINFNSTGETNQPPTPSTIEFKSRNQTTEAQTSSTPTAPKLSTPISRVNTTTGKKSQPSAQTPPANTPPQTRRVIEVIADRQEYDEDRHIVTAVGHVVVRFDGSVVNADRLQASLDNLIAVGEGNVTLTRGDQVLRGQSFTYNFIQDSGQLHNGRGEVFIPSAQKDFAFLPTDVSAGGVPQTPLSDRIQADQPVKVTNSPGGINITVGGSRGASNLPLQKQGGTVKRLRFEAANIDFYPRGWQARDVRITNDPFSPPELMLRADKVTLTRESPLRDRIKTVRQRLVFDQRTTLPIPKDEQTIDRSQRDTTPAIASAGYDGTDRGGLFIERSFKPVNLEGVNFSITPQFFVQKAVQNFSNPADLFGIKTKLTAVLSPKTVVQGFGNLTSLDFSKVETNLRANLRLRQSFGDDRNPNTLTLEYTYRDRLYNGSLGFQTVQSSLGGVVTSPIIPLGKSGVNLSYQAGVQSIDANTDRQDLLKPIRTNDRVTLTRLQGSIALSGGVPLWRGKPLPPTATEGLRYTANPVVPYLNANAGVTGTNSYYSNGDDQSTITGTVGLSGQLGHFSRPFLDYTAFNISYSQGIINGLSPFLFDRAVDNKVLNLGITQQIYGPFRFGFQTSINLDTGKSTSTDYVLEYSRRTYGITLRYNPDLQLGGISFRISDFNWTGGTDPFTDNSEFKPVVNGVRRDY